MFLTFFLFGPLFDISVFWFTALLKLEITVCFLWLSLPIYSGSVKRIYHLKQIFLIHPFSFECFHCSYTFLFLSLPSAYEMSRVMRKPDFCLCENKDADQLRGDREADQRLCFRYTDSTTLYFLNPKFQASSYIQ